MTHSARWLIAASVVSAWNVFGLAPAASAGPATDAGAVAPAVPLSVYDRVAPAMSVDSRAVLIAAGQGEDRLSAAPVPQSATAPGRVVFSTSTDGLTQAAVPVSRAQGIGSQFRARPTQSKEFIR